MAESEQAKLDLERTLRLMDVADALRRQQRRVTEHLEVSDREKIRAHLLQRYREMGHQADPALIDEAIDIVLSQRYRFQEPAEGLRLKLAMLYVNRGRWLRRRVLPVLVVLAVAIVGVLVVRTVGDLRAAQEERRGAQYAAQATELYERITDVAAEDAARARASQLYEQALSAARSGQVARLEEIVEELAALDRTLAQVYTIVIVRGRERDNARHYLIVQALDAQDRPLTMRIRNQETGDVQEVVEWGERVTEEIYRRVEQDYRQDKVIDDNIFGRKLRGHLDVERIHPDLGQITEY